jgi:hypothetical protein
MINHIHKDIFPPGAANNWWITARSPFYGMRAVLSEPTPRVEQNPALLRYGRMLKSGRGGTCNTALVETTQQHNRHAAVCPSDAPVCTRDTFVCDGSIGREYYVVKLLQLQIIVVVWGQQKRTLGPSFTVEKVLIRGVYVASQVVATHREMHLLSEE